MVLHAVHADFVEGYVFPGAEWLKSFGKILGAARSVAGLIALAGTRADSAHKKLPAFLEDFADDLFVA